MKVRVKLFGGYSLMSGQREFTLDMESPCPDAGHFLESVMKRFPGIREKIGPYSKDGNLFKTRLLLVVNGRIVQNSSEPIPDNAVIKLLDPVAGG